MNVVVLEDRLRALFDATIEVREITPDIHKVSIRQSSDEELTALDASNLAQEFTVRKKLLANALSIDQACELLGVKSRQTLHNWIEQRKVLGLTDNGRILLPLWQFDANTDDKIVAGLKSVLRVLKRRSFSAALWFTNANPALGNRTPISLLRAGKVDDVVAEAELADIIS